MLLDWFGQGGGLPSRRPPRRRRCTPDVELLESRALLSAGTPVPCVGAGVVADASHPSATPIVRKAIVGGTHAGRHLTLTKRLGGHHKRHHRHHPPIATTTVTPLPTLLGIVPPPTGTDPSPSPALGSPEQIVQNRLKELNVTDAQVELLTDE